MGTRQTVLDTPDVERVTTGELARALAALEARRQAALDRDLDTIALGEAISQLGLDFTADELLAEVRAQRTAAAPPATVLRSNRLRVPRFVRSWAPVLLVMAVLFGAITIRVLLEEPVVGARTWTPPASTAASWAPAGDVARTAWSPDEAGQRTLAMTSDELLGLARGNRTWSDIERRSGADWVVIQQGGRLYVRGWVLRPHSRGPHMVSPEPVKQLPAASQQAELIPISRIRRLTGASGKSDRMLEQRPEADGDGPAAARRPASYSARSRTGP